MQIVGVLLRTYMKKTVLYAMQVGETRICITILEENGIIIPIKIEQNDYIISHI